MNHLMAARASGVLMLRLFGDWKDAARGPGALQAVLDLAPPHGDDSQDRHQPAPSLRRHQSRSARLESLFEPCAGIAKTPLIHMHKSD